ncbi:flippase [Candidatus Woesearchaeota archaeon]|nr:flippase [Candidatus Woesearchaeota archaeon]
MPKYRNIDKKGQRKEKSERYRTIAKGAAYVLIGMVISKFLTYLYRMITAHLGTESYGLLSLGIAVIGVVSFVPLLGLDNGVLRYAAYYRQLKKFNVVNGIIRYCIRISAVLSCLLFVIMFFAAEYISVKFFNNSELTNIIRIFSVSLPFFALGSIYLAALRAFERIDYWVYAKNISESVVKILATVVLLALGFGIIGASIAYVLAIIVPFILAYFYIKKILPSRKSSQDASVNKEVSIYSFPLMLNVLFAQVIVWTDVIMLGYYKSASDAGIYNAALPTATLMSIIPGALLGLFIPVMTGIYAAKNIAEFKKTFSVTTKWILMFNMPIFLVLFLLGKEILTVFFGNEYGIGFAALNILVVGYLIYQALNPASEILNVIKKPKLVMLNTFIAAILNVILNALLIPKYGMIGGAVATSSSMVLFGILAAAEMYYHTKIIGIMPNMVKLLFAGTLIFLAYEFFISGYIATYNIYLRLIAGSCSIVVLYAALLLLMKCFEKEEVEVLKEAEAITGIKITLFRNFLKRFVDR